MFLHSEFGPHGEGMQGFKGICGKVLITAKIQPNN